MAIYNIYSWFSHGKWWFCIAMVNYPKIYILITPLKPAYIPWLRPTPTNSDQANSAQKWSSRARGRYDIRTEPEARNTQKPVQLRDVFLLSLLLVSQFCWMLFWNISSVHGPFSSIFHVKLAEARRGKPNVLRKWPEPRSEYGDERFSPGNIETAKDVQNLPGHVLKQRRSFPDSQQVRHWLVSCI